MNNFYMSIPSGYHIPYGFPLDYSDWRGWAGLIMMLVWVAWNVWVLHLDSKQRNDKSTTEKEMPSWEEPEK